MAISSYSTPTGGLNQLKFVKIKFSLETPTMAISLHHAYRMPKAKYVNKSRFSQLSVLEVVAGWVEHSGY